MRHHRARSVIVPLLALALVAACTGSDDEDPESSEPDEVTQSSPSGDAAGLVHTALGGGRGVQDFHIVLDLARVDEGDETESFMVDVIDHAVDNAQKPMEMESGLIWTPVDGFDGRVVDPDGETLPTVALDTGLLGMSDDLWSAVQTRFRDELDAEPDVDVPADVVAEIDTASASDAQAFVQIATPDYRQARVHAAPGDKADLDLTFVESIAPGDTIRSLHVFGQTFPADDASTEEGLSAHELFVQRFDEGRVSLVGSSEGVAVLTGDNEAVEGSTRIEIDFKGTGLEVAFVYVPTLVLSAIAIAPLFGPATPLWIAVIVGVVVAVSAGVGALVAAGLLNFPDEPCQLNSPPGGAGLGGAGGAGGGGGGGVPGVNDAPFDFPGGAPTQSSSIKAPAWVRAPAQAGGSEDCGGLHGDVHMRTFDGVRYDNQAVGEFVAYESDGAVVQVRQEPWGESDRVSMATAAAVAVDGVGISMHVDVGGTAWIDGEETEFARGESRPIGDGGALLWTGSNWVVVWPDGTVAWIVTFGGSLAVYVKSGSVTAAGLYGDGDGNPDNDFVTRDGQALTVADIADPDVVHRTFAHSWRIEASESLFHYDDGETTDTFTDLDFPYAAADFDADAEAEARALCEEAGLAGIPLQNCILDVALTGDEIFIASNLLDQMIEQRRGAKSSTDSAWTTGLDGLSPAIFHRPPVTDGEHVYVFGADVETDAGVLVAIDATDGSEAWRVEGVEPRCDAAELGDGRLVVVAPGGEGSVTEEPSVLVLDTTSGDVVVSAEWPEASGIGTYCESMQVAGDLVVIPWIGRLTAWSFAGDTNDAPTVAWAVDDLRGLSRNIEIVENHVVAVINNDDGTGRRAILVDLASGAIVDRHSIRGRQDPDGRHVVASGNTAIISQRNDVDDPQRVGTVTALGVEGGEFAPAWEFAIFTDDGDGEDDHALGIALSALAVDGDLLVGHIGSDDVAAVDVNTGELAWRLDPPGFRNTPAPAFIHDGAIYEGVFGGPYLVVMSTDGELLEEWPAEQLFGSGTELESAKTFGPVVDGRLFVTTDLPGQLVVTAVPVG